MFDSMTSIDAKEQMKRIKKLNSSVLLGNPSLPDKNSEIISKIGVLYGSGDSAKQ